MSEQPNDWDVIEAALDLSAGWSDAYEEITEAANDGKGVKATALAALSRLRIQHERDREALARIGKWPARGMLASESMVEVARAALSSGEPT